MVEILTSKSIILYLPVLQSLLQWQHWQPRTEAFPLCHEFQFLHKTCAQSSALQSHNHSTSLTITKCPQRPTFHFQLAITNSPTQKKIHNFSTKKHKTRNGYATYPPKTWEKDQNKGKGINFVKQCTWGERERVNGMLGRRRRRNRGRTVSWRQNRNWRSAQRGRHSRRREVVCAYNWYTVVTVIVLFCPIFTNMAAGMLPIGQPASRIRR